MAFRTSSAILFSIKHAECTSASIVKLHSVQEKSSWVFLFSLVILPQSQAIEVKQDWTKDTFIPFLLAIEETIFFTLILINIIIIIRIEKGWL